MRLFHNSLNVAGETRSDARVASEGPRAPGCKAASFHRRARACPSPCLGQEGNGVDWRAVFAQSERARGTGPRPTSQEVLATVARWENLSLAMPRAGKRPWLACGFRAERASAGDRPPPYEPRSSRHRSAVGKPVPRHASGGETAVAGVRFSRRASERGGQAPALRAKKFSPP